MQINFRNDWNYTLGPPYVNFWICLKQDFTGNRQHYNTHPTSIVNPLNAKYTTIYLLRFSCSSTYYGSVHGHFLCLLVLRQQIWTHYQLVGLSVRYTQFFFFSIPLFCIAHTFFHSVVLQNANNYNIAFIDWTFAYSPFPSCVSLSLDSTDFMHWCCGCIQSRLTLLCHDMASCVLMCC